MFKYNGYTDNYGIFETERHLHSNESWFGAAATPNGEIHVADRIAPNIAAFQADAGNDTWGSWLQVLGSSDTPARTGNIYFDPHRFIVVGIERSLTPYFIQVSAGASGDAGLAADNYTEFVVQAGAATERAFPGDIQARRFPAGTKAWVRVLAYGQNTGTIDFYYGIHEYER